MILYVAIYYGIWRYFGIEWVIIISLAQLTAKVLMVEEGLFGDDDDEDNVH